jgi:glycosyltransferase involved in cell wall biosynthesis
MADAAEILKFKEYKDRYGRDDYGYEAITDQLRGAIRNGHDVQLHLHPSYFNATHENGRWVQDWSEYDFAGLPFARMAWMVRTGKEFLEDLLRAEEPGYRCIAFRAANWSVEPSREIVRALLANAITVDTSVFKYGRRSGIVNFDYSRAYSNREPWPVKEDDICGRDENGLLWEVPIYSEQRWLGAFLTAGRIARSLQGRRHRIPPGTGAPAAGGAGKTGRGPAAVMLRQAWKADLNQCSGRQLVHALERATRPGAGENERDLPFVLIGHSKLFSRRNERLLAPFLDHAVRHADRFAFDTLHGIAQRLCARRDAASREAGQARPGRAAGSRSGKAPGTLRERATAPCVLITPAHNEEAFIEKTLESVAHQSIRPLAWFVVNDGSTDGTGEIVERYAARYPFIRSITLKRPGGRHFGNKVRAFNQGLAEARMLGYRYVGNLDADIALEPDYLENILDRFQRDPDLGIAGGMVSTCIEGRFVSQEVSSDSVAGAVQMFRRECFEEIGGYLPLPQGGIDAAAEIAARMKGWTVRTFPELCAREHRRTGTAAAGPLSAYVKLGKRFHSLGYGFLYMCLRSAYRFRDRPRLLGSLAALSGYVLSALRGQRVVLPPDLVNYLRAEHRAKIMSLGGLLPAGKAARWRKPASANSVER